MWTASPQERLLRPWAEFLLVAPPAEQQERTPLERQRRWPAQEVSKNITSRQMESRKLRHRASSDKSVAPLGHDTGTPRERERLGDGADNTRDATLGWLKSGTGVPGPSRRGLRRRKPSSDTQAPPPLGECQKLSVSPVSDHQRQAMSVMPAVRQDSDEESRPEKAPPDGCLKKVVPPRSPRCGLQNVGCREEPSPQPRSPHCEGE